MKMYRLRSVNPNPDLFLIAKNEAGLSSSLYPYVIKNGIRQMYAFKEHELEGVDLKDLPEGTYIITEYEHGQVVEANNFGSCTIYKPPQPMEPDPKLIDRYWELRREIMNTPPIYFWKHKKLFREYKEVKEKIESRKNAGTPHKPMKTTIELVEQWAEEKGILSKATPLTQAIKTKEEVNELYHAILDEDREEIKDAIGDIMVTLIIQCKMQGMDLQDCLESAYNVIKNRTGKMVDGVFVKD